MRKLITFIAVLILNLLISGCKKDNNVNKDSEKNTFKYNNTEHTIVNAFFETNGVVGGGYANINLMLLSSGFTIHESNGIISSISGTGAGLMFEFFTSSSDKLDEIDYVYDASGSGTAGSFVNGVVFENLDMDTSNGTEYEITGGKVSVRRNESGSEYVITINCTTSDGKIITGNYQGIPKFILIP